MKFTRFFLNPLPVMLAFPKIVFTAALALVCIGSTASAAANAQAFTPLFNGTSFDGWIVPKGDNGHWKIVDGVIDYDAQSEAPGDKNLWTKSEYADFVLRVEWRIK